MHGIVTYTCKSETRYRLTCVGAFEAPQYARSTKFMRARALLNWIEWYSLSFCLFVSNMDSFDRQILAVLKDGKSTDFHQILKEVRFSHNTLGLHPTSLEREGTIVKAETAKNGPERPSFTYALPPNTRQRVDLVVTELQTTIVSLTFQKLRHLCRFEKGGYCKRIRNKCAP